MNKYLFSLLTLAAAAFAGCSSDPEEPVTIVDPPIGEPIEYTITFHTNGGSEIEPQTIVEGEYAEVPVPPTHPVFAAFDGWFTDDDTFESAFDFEATPVTADLDLYAKWATVSLETLTLLIEQAEQLEGSLYTLPSHAALIDALEDTRAVAADPASTDEQIFVAYGALRAALDGLEKKPYAAVATILIGASHLSPVNGEFLVLSGSNSIPVYVLDSNGAEIENPAVTHEVEPVDWLDTSTNVFGDLLFTVEGDTPAESVAAVTIRSATDPGVSISFSIRVVAPSSLMGRFLDAAAALPDPARVDYTDSAAIEGVQYLYTLFSNSANQEEVDSAEVQAAFARVNEIQAALFALPTRIRYSISGDVAEHATFRTDGSSYIVALRYELSGAFPCGTYTTAWEDYGDQWWQDRLTLDADGTFRWAARMASDGLGTGADEWEDYEHGTYTYTGTREQGGMLYLTAVYDNTRSKTGVRAGTRRGSRR